MQQTCYVNPVGASSDKDRTETRDSHVVREANISDLAPLLRLHRQLYEEYRVQLLKPEQRILSDYRDMSQVLKTDMEGLLQGSSTRVLVGLDRNDEAVGYISGRLVTETRRVLPSRGVLEDWYVTEGHRGKGLGMTLFHKLKGLFVDRGCQVMESNTWPNNGKTRRLHERLGFSEVEIKYRKRLP